MNSINDDVWIVDPKDYEDQCECIRSRTAYIYTYPFVKEVWEAGAKVITRDNRVVKKIRMESSMGVTVIVGILDGEEIRWDAAGRFEGPYKDSPKDLRICERYFYKDWPQDIRMSNAEWTLRYGRRHPFAKIPK